MANPINRTRGTDAFAGFSWPEVDSQGRMVAKTTVHIWQCDHCHQAVGHHIVRTERNESVPELLTQCIEALRQHRQTHSHSIEHDQHELLAAD